MASSCVYSYRPMPVLNLHIKVTKTLVLFWFYFCLFFWSGLISGGHWLSQRFGLGYSKAVALLRSALIVHTQHVWMNYACLEPKCVPCLELTAGSVKHCAL